MMGAMTSQPAGGPADLFAYLDGSPSPFHAVGSTASRLGAAGFVERDEAAAWSTDPGRWFIRRGGSIVAWVTTERHRPTSGFRVVGAHTDSPNLRVKPGPDTGRAGHRQIGVEIYGGVLLNSWLDRDLGLSGRIVLDSDGSLDETLLLVDRPLMRVPQLAIHLDRDITQSGLQLNPQQHLVPTWGLGTSSPGELMDFVADQAGVGPGSILGWDLMLHDLTPATLGGVDDEFIFSARLDNLLSCHSATVALVSAAGGDPDAIPVICLFDHEEVGSVSASGASSSMLPSVLERIIATLGGGRDELHVALAGSACVSADGAHGTHPNYADRHEPDHHIALNGGPVIKHNANERYATNGTSAAMFARACRDAGLDVQHFVNRADMPCGSTIGPVTAARLGIDTVDAGVAQLAMHSAREMVGSADPARFTGALTAFLQAD